MDEEHFSVLCYGTNGWTMITIHDCRQQPTNTNTTQKTKTKKAEKGCVTKHGADEMEMWRNSLTGWEFWDLYDRVHEGEGGSVVDFFLFC